MAKKALQTNKRREKKALQIFFKFLKKAIRVISFIFLYLLVTVAFPLLPTVFMMWYKTILNYEIRVIEFAPDIAIAVVGIVASSLWGNIWLNKRTVSSEVKFLVLILRVFVILSGYSLYSFVFGFDPLKLFSLDLDASIPSFIFITCGIILFLNTIWELFFEIKARYSSDSQTTTPGDSTNE